MLVDVRLQRIVGLDALAHVVVMRHPLVREMHALPMHALRGEVRHLDSIGAIKALKGSFGAHQQGLHERGGVRKNLGVLFEIDR